LVELKRVGHDDLRAHNVKSLRHQRFKTACLFPIIDIFQKPFTLKS
jgi:hypothetical protein